MKPKGRKPQKAKVLWLMFGHNFTIIIPPTYDAIDLPQDVPSHNLSAPKGLRGCVDWLWSSQQKRLILD